MDANLDFESGFGPDAAQEAFESMVESADDQLMKRMEEAEQNIQKEAQQRSPVDTGNLRASWTGLTEARRGTIMTEVGNTADYAEFVEKGTSKMAAQPMLRPAMDREQMALIRDIEQLVFRVAAQEGNA
ncbi:HK97-gp10 family putative phage morphogenesis protein [Natrinema sp. CGMCC1.2065]|uniref:HK97-gp10 family putative phage morphogenesis protein n=1 Tax=Natrinema sp. CGMCC1.2065 TaxID=3445767 RepID=UPI003F4A4222